MKNSSLSVILFGLIGLMAAVFLTTIMVNYRILDEKRSDALIINLAGRQRMLTQKFTKEYFETLNENVLAVAATPVEPEPEEEVAASDDIDLGALLGGDSGSASEEESKPAKARNQDPEITRQVFEKTMVALTDGGETWSDLVAREPVSLPKNDDEETRELLGKVKSDWSRLLSMMDEMDQAVASGQMPTAEDLVGINGQSVKCLGVMNQAVGVFQRNSDARLSSLIQVQIVGLALTLILGFLVVLAIRKRVIRPLAETV